MVYKETRHGFAVMALHGRPIHVLGHAPGSTMLVLHAGSKSIRLPRISVGMSPVLADLAFAHGVLPSDGDYGSVTVWSWEVSVDDIEYLIHHRDQVSLVGEPHGHDVVVVHDGNAPLPLLHDTMPN